MQIAQIPTDTLSEIFDGLIEFLPNLLAAVGFLAAGWLVGRILKALTVRLLGSWSSRIAGGVGRLFRSRDVERRVRTGTSRPVAGAIGRIVFWLVFLVFLAAATEVLGLPVISTWISGVAGYLPRVIAAGLIILLGVLAGNLARSAASAGASSAGFAYADVLGRLSQGVIVMISLIVAFDQLGLEITFLIVIAAIILGASLGGAALAFGLGARTAVSNIIAAHYVVKTFRVGHQVRIGEYEGRVLELTPTAVILGTPEGRLVIPAKEFSERASILITS
jgi:hypothetical protein